MVQRPDSEDMEGRSTAAEGRCAASERRVFSCLENAALSSGWLDEGSVSKNVIRKNIFVIFLWCIHPCLLMTKYSTWVAWTGLFYITCYPKRNRVFPPVNAVCSSDPSSCVCVCVCVCCCAAVCQWRGGGPDGGNVSHRWVGQISVVSGAWQSTCCQSCSWKPAGWEMFRHFVSSSLWWFKTLQTGSGVWSDSTTHFILQSIYTFSFSLKKKSPSSKSFTNKLCLDQHTWKHKSHDCSGRLSTNMLV